MMTERERGTPRRDKREIGSPDVLPQMMVERRQKWWRLCRDAEAKPSSLGEFLEVERRFGDSVFMVLLQRSLKALW
jgi:hypothetical protein|uniref:Uncharacterized protein n=1 Tax=Fagus sylvatica TaxID=28930 RepID=A0A2N9FBT8_FAGSY